MFTRGLLGRTATAVAASLFGVAVSLAMLPAPASADTAFDGFKSEVFGARPIRDGRSVIKLEAPYRPDDVRAVPLRVAARLTDGRTISKITFIVDNNPSPVVAAFELGGARTHAAIGVKFRLNQQSDVRAVVEASDGELYMVHQLVKFAGGQAACAAPPSAPPEVIAANLGKMRLAEVPAPEARTNLTARLKLELSHPNHTGMVLDQQTLLYTPVKMVEAITVTQTSEAGSETVFKMSGSIGLNENPEIEFDLTRNGAANISVDVLDTDGQRFVKVFPANPSS